MRPGNAILPEAGAQGADAGFSLIEALVALVVFSIAAVALMNVQGESARALRALDDRFLAEIAAENVLVRQHLAGRDSELLPLQQSGVEEVGARRWHWTARRSPVDGPFTRMDIDVADRPDGQVVYSISSLDTGDDR